MFIKIRYGNDELMLCNPQCSVNNLLDSITTRCGMKCFGKILDLSDETGLVLRLNDHREDYADLYLKNHSTYILVQKQELLNTTEEDSLLPDHHALQDGYLTAGYIPLLENYSTLLPNFKLRVAVETASSHRQPKSPARPSSKAGHGYGPNKSPNRKHRRTKDTKTKSSKESH